VLTRHRQAPGGPRARRRRRRSQSEVVQDARRLVLLVGVVLLWQGWVVPGDFGPRGPRFMPVILAVGWILLAAGLVGLLITIWFWNSRRRTVVTRQTTQPVNGAPARPVQYDEYRETRRDDVPPPPPPGY